MATAFPTALDAFTNPSGSNNLGDSVGGRTHAQLHADINDALEAVQAKLGVNGSAVVTSVDYRLAMLEASRSRAVARLGADVVVTNNAAAVTLIQGTIDLAEATAGAIYEIDASGYYLNNTGVNQTMTFGFRIGGTVIYLDTSAAKATSAQARAWSMRAHLRFQSTNIQRIAGLLNVGGNDAPTTPAGVPGTSGGLGVGGVAYSLAASSALVLATFGTTTIDVQHTHGVANANLTLGCTSAFIRKV